MHCTNCGAKLPEGTKNFCPFCGEKIPDLFVSEKTGEFLTSHHKNQPEGNIVNSLFNTTKTMFSNVVQMAQNRQEPSKDQSAYTSYISNRTNTYNSPVLTNCPNCGSPIDSFASHCRFCGTEIIQKAQASACRDLCDRLDMIEASRPKETLLSFTTGLANMALKRNKIAPTDQQKIELISSFVVPNTKADIMEFLFLSKTRMTACESFSSETDEDVARVQSELYKVWSLKFEQTLEKAKLLLPDDLDFKSFLTQYERENNRKNNVCQYCGGKFKGLFQKTCTKCGKPKDY